jgi:hypothetical protein
MAESKTFFRQISIETVKRIAKEFPAGNAIGGDAGSTATLDEVRSPRESWREVAERVQQERDPQRVIELVEQLIATLDQEQLSKRLPRNQDAENRSD